jgi:nuclear pore complex protein Nup160
VLEVQSVDLVEDKGVKGDGLLTFRIALPSTVLPNGVACADPDEHDALEIFALTTTGEIYTFTLKRDLLSRENVPHDFDGKTCFRKYTSSSLAFRHPYRFVAISSLELLVSLSDGGLLRLQRQANDSGSQWRETFFSEGGWSGTLRGLIPLKRHQTISYGNVELEPNAIAAMAKSPDGKYIWTVSLDHMLRAWSTQTGRKVAQMDILGEVPDEEGKKQQKYLLGAEQGTLLQVVSLPPSRHERRVAKTDEGQEYYLVLHSPKLHQFKFYKVSTPAVPTEGDAVDFEDIAAGQKLIPPIDELMNTNIWHLEEFYVHAGPDWQGTRIWLRARSGTLTQNFTMAFDFFDEEKESLDLEVPWQSGWSVVDRGLQSVEAIRSLCDFPGDLEDFTNTASTQSEKWLDFLFKPGRFSTASIEAALHIYRKGRGLPASTGGRGLNAPELPLKERLLHAITSKIILRRQSGDQLDYEKYKNNVQEQWKTYFSLLSHLHGRRNETIGLCFDAAYDLAWTIGAGFVAPVREGDRLEHVVLNSHIVPDEKMQSIEENVVNRIFPETEQALQSAFLAVARKFYSGLSADFKQQFMNKVITEAISHDTGDAEHNKKRMSALYDESGLAAEVMDDDFDALEEAADVIGGLGNVTTDFLVGLLDLIGQAPDGRRKVNNSLNRYGAKFVVAVAEETLERDRQCLLEILTLVVLMNGEFDPGTLDGDFVTRIDEFYDATFFRLKNNELLSWMIRNEVPESTRHRRSGSAEPQEPEVPVVTLFERIAYGDWEPKSKGNESFPELLTLWSKQWTFGARLFEQWDGTTGYVLATLLKEQFYDLASDFQRFLNPDESSSGWTKYLQGRWSIATGDYALASLKFQAAAADMAQLEFIATKDSAYLLSDVERNGFGAGQTAFYQHVVALFEKLKIWSYTADFARLALDCLENSMDADRMYEQDRHRHDPDSSQVDIIDAVMEQQKLLKGAGSVVEELLSRLFNALLQTGRFQEAFDALKQLDDVPVKRSELRKLLDACVKQDAVQDLLALPFEEANLVQEADAVLLSLAKKELAATTTSTARPPFYQILYAFRTQRSDFRGAAELLYEHLERMRQANQKHGMQDPEDNTLIHAYVLLINTLACCGEEDAWLLADPIDGLDGQGNKRRLVQIADVRREYAAELDRRSDILQGRFPLLVGDVGGDEMDVL